MDTSSQARLVAAIQVNDATAVRELIESDSCPVFDCAHLALTRVATVQNDRACREVAREILQHPKRESDELDRLLLQVVKVDGNVEMVRVLLEEVGDAVDVNVHNGTALFDACASSASSEIVDTLLQHGANPLLRDGTLLSVCMAKRDLFGRITVPTLRTVRVLIEHGLPVDMLNAGEPILVLFRQALALREQFREITTYKETLRTIRAFVEAGAAVNLAGVAELWNTIQAGAAEFPTHREHDELIPLQEAMRKAQSRHGQSVKAAGRRAGKQ